MIYLINPDYLAAVTIWAEAQGEPYRGKVAVGEVIRNRMKRRYTSDGTVAGTVAKRFQFSFWNDDNQNNKLLIKALNLKMSDPMVRESVDAWTEAATSNYVKGAVLYLNKKIVNPWPNWVIEEKEVVTIGHHTFYLD